MRKSLIYTALVIPLFCFIACKKDNNNQPQTLIVGKWNFLNESFTLYRNDTLVNNGSFSNSTCTCSIQFNNDGTYSDFYTVTGMSHGDTTSGNYAITGKIINFSITNDRGYLRGIIIPTPAAFFIGGQLDELNMATNSDQITQLTSANLSVHAVVTSTPSASGVYKAVIDETYTR